MTPVLGELFNGCLDDVHVLAKALDDGQARFKEQGWRLSPPPPPNNMTDP